MLLDHFESQKVVQFLTVSPDIYGIEVGQLYSYLNNDFSNSHDFQSLIDVTDSIDELYRNIYERVTKNVPTKYAQESFVFHKWLSPTDLIVGSVSL